MKAEDRFLDALAGITDPQEKRRRIGHMFIDCFGDEAAKIKDAEFLAQGTLYPDVIESGAAADGPAATIKLHHNVGGLPEDLQFKLDRAAARSVQRRSPRAGPRTRPAGRDRLAASVPRARAWRCAASARSRSRGSTSSARPTRSSSARSRRRASIAQTSQAFAVLLPVQSVGVMGDARTYEDAIAVRCVNTEDFMTADWSRLPYDLLARISTRIINEVKGVNRVVLRHQLEAAGDDRVGIVTCGFTRLARNRKRRVAP